MNVKPLADKIVIRPIENENKTASGIIIPDTAKEKPNRGIVEAVGPGALNKIGKRISMNVKVGDKIIYNKYSGTEIKIEGQDYLIAEENDIIAIIES